MALFNDVLTHLRSWFIRFMQTEISKALPTLPGMGAIYTDAGTTFRVWAPHATEVFVSGEFNNWHFAQYPLHHEEKGYWAVHVPGVQRWQQYKFRIISPFGEFFRNDPYAKQLTSSIGNSQVIDPQEFDWGPQEAEFRMGAWNELVIYELHIGSFNTPGNGQAGTFYSAIERLDYLQSLGINAVEVMPIAEFPGDLSWGYNPAHPFAVEIAYGGVNGFKEFVKQCHRRGIAVILDVVYNHLGPSDLDIWQFDGWQENGKGGIYFYNDWRSQTPWGDTRPDYGRPEVQQYLRDNAIMWLEEYHVDGLRMDMVPYIRNVHADGNPGNELSDGYNLIRRINGEIRGKYPFKFTVAEDMHGLDRITEEIANGGLGYSSQWDAEFIHPIRQMLLENDDSRRDLDAVVAALLHSYNTDAFRRVIYTESHDEVSNGRARIAHDVAGGDVNSVFAKKRSTLGAALVLTAPGVPMLFQGQTILAPGWFDDNDPLDWSRLHTFHGIARMYHDMIHLRRNLHGTTRGLQGQHTHVYHRNHSTRVLAYHRWMDGGPGDSTVVVVNLCNQPYENYEIGFPAAGEWDLRYNSDFNGYDENFANTFSFNTAAGEHQVDELPFSGRVNIGPYAMLIYSQQK